MSEWVEQYFRDVDTMDVDLLLSHLSDDIVVKWANNDPAVGKQAFTEAITGFYQSISGLEHEMLRRYDEGAETIVEANVYYTRNDGRRVRCPAMTVLRRESGLIDELRVYVDTAPVFEP